MPSDASSALIASWPNRVVIYGWHQPDGTPIQPLSKVHVNFYADYSHGVRLVLDEMTLDGQPTTVRSVLADPALHVLLSDEGRITAPGYVTPAPPETFPFHDEFPLTGPELSAWRARFVAPTIVPTGSAAPGGDGYALRVMDPAAEICFSEVRLGLMPDWGGGASLTHLVGTIMFNLNTADAMITGMTWRETDLLVWTPNMVGCVCFLVASYLAYAEVSHGAASFAPRSVSWWIAVVNLLGSVAFQLSALYSFAGPEPAAGQRLVERVKPDVIHHLAALFLRGRQNPSGNHLFATVVIHDDVGGFKQIDILLRGRDLDRIGMNEPMTEGCTAAL